MVTPSMLFAVPSIGIDTLHYCVIERRICSASINRIPRH